MSLLSFLDDYSEGAHPVLLKKLLDTNLSQEIAYGDDQYTQAAKGLIRDIINDTHAAVHLVSNGTLANILAIGASLRPYEAVIAADSGHIVVRETGAIEAVGHKILHTPACNGKLTPDSIRKVLESNLHFPHTVKPRLVYISNATETGTIYTKAELTEISELCRQKNLLLLMDGARLGVALAAEKNDLTLAEIAQLVDIFWIGGTKVGMLLGEAIVIPNKRIAEDFDLQVKQRGALLSKRRVLGVQFHESFQSNLFFELSKHSNAMARQLSTAVTTAGYQLASDTETNQVFAELPDSLVAELGKEFRFYIWEKKAGGITVIRLVTSWATTETMVTAFAKRLIDLAKP